MTEKVKGGKRSGSKKRSRRIARRRKMLRRKIAMTMAVTIITLVALLACMKFTATKTVAENKSKFSKKYYRSYMIEPGDSLWSIAEKECGSMWHNNWDYIDEVMRINGLHSETIHAGRYLTLPYYT